MSGFKQIIAKLRGVRNLELLVLLSALAVVALLLLNNNAQEPVVAATGTALETRMEAVLSEVKGAGRVRVLLREKEGTVSAFSTSASAMDGIEGVVVVAEGADDVRVALELARAVKALLGVEMERIEVLRMERSGRG